MKKRTSSVLMYTTENIARIAVIFIFTLTCVVMGIAMFDDNSVGEANIGSFNTYTFNKSWELNDCEGKREVTLPLKLSKSSPKHVTIENTLPYDVTDGMSMMIRSSMEDIKIYIDGELREEYSSDTLQGTGYYIPSAYVVVQLSAQDASKPIKIDLNFKTAHVINEVKLSYGNNVWFDVIKEDYVVTIIALFTLVLGVSLHVGAAIVRTNFKSDSAKVLGLLMSTIALWVISESKLRQFIFRRPSLAHLFSYILIELVGVMACMYFDEVQHKTHHKSYLIAEVVVLVQLFLNVILHATGVAEFYQTMAFSHFWAALCGIVGFTNIVIDIKNGRAKEYSIIMYGMICFIIMALSEIIGFYRTPYHILGIQLGLALLTLTICTVIQTIHDEVEKYKLREINYTKITINTIETIASSIDARDEYTGGHSERVGLYAERLAREMAADYDFSEDDIRRIRYIGLVHDIGKIGVSDGVLNKKGRLTIEEYDEMKRHTEIGYEIMKPLGSGIDGLLDGIKYHHERFDGKGYPEHLSDTDIPLVARIIAIADCYDAMTTNRVYRKRLSDEKVRAELIKGAGTQFDPALIEIFIRLVDAKIIDSPVKLENDY